MDLVASDLVHFLYFTGSSSSGVRAHWLSPDIVPSFRRVSATFDATCRCSRRLLEFRVTKTPRPLCMYAGIRCRGQHFLFHLNPRAILFLLLSSSVTSPRLFKLYNEPGELLRNHRALLPEPGGRRVQLFHRHRHGGVIRGSTLSHVRESSFGALSVSLNYPYIVRENAIRVMKS